MNFTNSSSDVLGEVDPYPFEKFAPTLTQCFVLTIVGYLTAKFELISASDMRGIGVFATYFGLPGIVWDTLADSDFSDFCWELIIGLLLGKFLIFAVVCGLCLLLTGNVGLAGLVALYCVHSNDLPVGCPLMSSLYKDFRSHMMKYLFLMPSVTTIFIIPIGNYMIEYYKYEKKEVSQQKNKDSEHRINCLPRKKMVELIKDVIRSPIVVATLTGIVLNLIFKGKVPPVLHQPIHVVAATIPGLVLIILGFSMVRKDRHIISSAIVYAMFLVVIKMIVTPLVLHVVVRAVTTHCNSSLFLSDFALLYGILPPATAVFLSGLEFRKPLASMGAALIICSFASYPLSYVVARFTIAAKYELNYYVPQLQNCLFWMACINIACNIFTWILIMRRKEWNKVPCCYVMCLIFSQCALVLQLAVSCGILFWYFDELQQWSLYPQMALYYGGEISGCIWISTISVVSILSKKYPALPERGFLLLFCTAFGLSVLMTALMGLLVSFDNLDEVYFVGRPKTYFEFRQLTATTVLLALCTFVITVYLILYFKRNSPTSPMTENNVGDNYPNKEVYENSVFYLECEDVIPQEAIKKNPHLEVALPTMNEKAETDFYYNDVICKSRSETNLHSENEWKFRIFSLLLLLGMVMTVRLLSNIYKLVSSSALEVLIPLEFLQSILFVGQGFFTFLIFGIDVRAISFGLIKRWRKMKNGKEEFVPGRHGQVYEVMQVGQQFMKYYYEQCFRNLAKERRWKGNVYKDCFWGHQLINWMIEEGIAKDDEEAEEIGQKLLICGIIRHYKGVHHFYDAPYLYFFVRNSSESSS